MGANQSNQNGGQNWTPEMINQYQQQMYQQQMYQQQQQQMQKKKILEQQVLAQQRKAANTKKYTNLSTEQRFKLQQQQMRNMINQQQQEAMMNQRQFNNNQNKSRETMSKTINQSGYYPRMQPIMQNNGEIINSSTNVSVNTNNFAEEERQREIEFERQEKLRREKFMEEQRERRNAFNNEMTTFKNSKFDPYKILSLTENYTLKELKKSYKIMAMKSHPDRGGDPRVFKIVTKSYIFLLNELKRKNNSHGHNDLQKNSHNYMDTQTTNVGHTLNSDDGKFNINKFNKIYNENRLDTVDDYGYGDWISSTKMEEDYEPEKIFSDDFNINVFNSMFKKNQKTKQQNSIVEYQEPNALNSANQVACIELGRTKIKDFSSSNVSAVASNKKKLHFTDYKKAHTETTFTDKCDNVKRRNFNSIGDLKVSRKNIKYTMNARQRELYERKKRAEKQHELDRQRRVETTDRQAFSNYHKINNLILGGNTNTDNGYKQIEYKR